jgi:hypothetical protein
VSLIEGDADKHIDVRIWVVQVFMWTSCIFIGKIVVFFQEVIYYRELLYVGNLAMSYMDLNSSPELQLITVMVLIPVIFNSIMFWIQDNYLKGDKHAAARIAKEVEAKRLERLRLAELSRIRARAKDRDLADFSDKSAESDHSFVDI